MSSINKVFLIGRLGKDPEVRYTQAGTAICNLSLATSRSWKDKNSGERVEETEWHRVSLFDRMAEIAGEYLGKGSQVYIEGRLSTRKWQDKDGKDNYTTEIIASELKMLGSRNDDGGQKENSGRRSNGRQQNSRNDDDDSGGGNRNNRGNNNNRNNGNGNGNGNGNRKGGGKTNNTGFDDMDDDIPF